MSEETDQSPLRIVRQAYGSFEPHTRIGPAQWPCHDLFWVHRGAVHISTKASGARIDLAAPSGVLIAPGTRFAGATGAVRARASITHFYHQARRFEERPFVVAPPKSADALQAMVELSQTYAHDQADDAVRIRLIAAVLDAFLAPPTPVAPTSRIALAWQQAETCLHSIRGLADVAALAGLSESAFRAAHRKAYASSAGQHLVDLRVASAKRLLSTTSRTAASIAKDVGYRHAGSFFHAFRRRTRKTPTEFRSVSGPFA